MPIDVRVLGALLASALCACGSSEKPDDDHADAVGICPEIAPRGMPVEPCDKNLPTEGCKYTLECQTGAREFTFRCPNEWHWYVDEEPCEFLSDFCTGGEQQVRCGSVGEDEPVWGGSFSAYDGPAPCPTETQKPGDPCSDSMYSPLSCGYFCDDGSTWTVGYCSDPTWVFDGACTGG